MFAAKVASATATSETLPLLILLLPGVVGFLGGRFGLRARKDLQIRKHLMKIVFGAGTSTIVTL